MSSGTPPASGARRTIIYDDCSDGRRIPYRSSSVAAHMVYKRQLLALAAKASNSLAQLLSERPQCRFSCWLYHFSIRVRLHCLFQPRSSSMRMPLFRLFFGIGLRQRFSPSSLHFMRAYAPRHCSRMFILSALPGMSVTSSRL